MVSLIWENSANDPVHTKKVHGGERKLEVSFLAGLDSGVVGIRKVLTKVVNKGLGFVKQQSKTKRYLPSDRNF